MRTDNSTKPLVDVLNFDPRALSLFIILHRHHHSYIIICGYEMECKLLGLFLCQVCTKFFVLWIIAGHIGPRCQCLRGVLHIRCCRDSSLCFQHILYAKIRKKTLNCCAYDPGRNVVLLDNSHS